MYSIWQVCLIGIGTVFCGLIILICLVELMGKLMAEKPSAAPQPQAAAPVNTAADEEEEEIAAVIAAAVAETMNGSCASVRIVSIEKIGA